MCLKKEPPNKEHNQSHYADFYGSQGQMLYLRGTWSSKELLSFIQYDKMVHAWMSRLFWIFFKEQLENQSRIFWLLKQGKWMHNPSFKFAHVKEGDMHTHMGIQAS